MDRYKLRNQMIYCIYVRNHTEEGTFLSVIPDLDRIKALGTDIIWLMPVHPIGVVNKKGTLGCPYAIRDYRDVNPAYGTMADFRALVAAIHQHDMKCIIDVVYNHTSPDAQLVREHPEFYYRKPDGRMGNRVGEWTDVVDLDYNNKVLWDYQIETLCMWAELVDGFRCDVASVVPVEFWKKARQACEAVRPGMIWLAESVHQAFIKAVRSEGFHVWSDGELYQAFDMTYDYDIWHIYEAWLKGEKGLEEYTGYLNFQDAGYPEDYVKMRCLENHDQPRIASYTKDRQRLKNLTAFMFFEKGAALIYAGQEMLSGHRPSLFEKEPVVWNKTADISDFIRRLCDIKQHEIFARGNYRLNADAAQGTITGCYELQDKKIIGVFPVEDRKITGIAVELPDGEYKDQISGDIIKVCGGQLHTEAAVIIFCC